MLYSAYLYDTRDGWHGIFRIKEEDAIQYCKDYRSDWNGRVALVPYGADPEPYFAIARGANPVKPHLRLVA